MLTNGKLPDSDLREFVAGCKILVAINDSYDDDDFVRSTIVRSKNRLNDVEARDVYVYLAGESMSRASVAAFSKSQNKSLTPEMLAHCEKLREVWAQGSTKDQIKNGSGQFGLSLDNPVPTICVKGSNLYLSRLRYRGQSVESKRLGSTTSSVTLGNIDIYAISQNGEDIATIYICPYHRKDSKLAPEGFSIG